MISVFQDKYTHGNYNGRALQIRSNQPNVQDKWHSRSDKWLMSRSPSPG